MRGSSLTFGKIMYYLKEVCNFLAMIVTASWPIAMIVGLGVAQIFTALFVLADFLNRRALERPIFIRSGVAWFLIVFVTPYFLGALGYWIVHYSRASRFDD
jgi:hypothetical protein